MEWLAVIISLCATPLPATGTKDVEPIRIAKDKCQARVIECVMKQNNYFFRKSPDQRDNAMS